VRCGVSVGPKPKNHVYRAKLFASYHLFPSLVCVSCKLKKLT